MALKSVGKSAILLGQCVPCLKQNTSKFKVRRLELDTNLLYYFKKEDFIYAHDPEQKCKTGDIVLIEPLPQKLTRLVTHKVKDVIYHYGDITDPITGKKVVAGKFRDHLETIKKTYGQSKTKGYDYDKAPPRGWQEDKKDFSHVETYRKYHDDGTEQPYST